jgi:hypothetical protein
MIRHQLRLGLLVLLAGGCSPAFDATAGKEPALEPIMPLTAEGVRVAVVEQDSSTIVVRLDAMNQPVGSVQGEIGFDPSVLRVLEVTAVTSAYAAINSGQLDAGRIRFATFSPAALPLGDLLRLRVVRLGALAGAGVTVRLEAVGTPEGLAIAADRLRPAQGVFRAHP